MDNELALRLFVSVVEETSFSKGGARLGVPQSSASRMITKLEERLGARLLQRSTRKLTLTEAGQIYFERATMIVTELDAASEAIRNISSAPKGLLRVSASAPFGRLIIAPALKEFHALYPDVTFGLYLSDTVEDIIGLGYDVAIRLGDLQDSSLIARHLANSALLICASPSYLQTHGMPQSPEDLKNHNCLQFRKNPGQNTWRFLTDGVQTDIQVSGSLFANNGEALLSAAVSGLGISLLPEWMVHTCLDEEKLQLVLPDFALANPSLPIHAVAGYRQHVPAKQRVFIDFLHKYLSAMPWNRS